MKTKTAYQSNQFLQNYPDGVEKNFWNLARNAFLLRACAPYRLEPLLEIGAGRGVVLLGFHWAGWQVQGVELSPEATPIQPNLPLRSSLDAFEMPISERQRYRSLGLFDVLEHLPARPAFLNRLLEAFPNAKYLYLTVPALPALWTNYDEYYGHYLRYTMRQLHQELREGGWKPIKTRYFFHALVIPIWLQKHLGRQREMTYKPPSSALSKAFHRLVGWYFSIEWRVLPRQVPGSSLFCIAERT